jgi:hypothetical protein
MTRSGISLPATAGQPVRRSDAFISQQRYLLRLFAVPPTNICLTAFIATEGKYVFRRSLMRLGNNPDRKELQELAANKTLRVVDHRPPVFLGDKFGDEIGAPDHGAEPLLYA